MSLSELSESLFFTIIIPTYNRADILSDCLLALAKQTINPEFFEVIVGNDGSKDHTLSVLQQLKEVVPYRLRFFSQENKGPNVIRNRAIKMAEAPVVVFFNDDTIALPDCLENHLIFHKRFSEENIAVLGKLTIDPSIPATPFSQVALDLSYAQWQGKRNLDWRAFYTCNLSVKKSFLLKYGLFDENIWYNDDVELGSRLDRHGLRIIYCWEAVGYHRHYLSEQDYLAIAEKDGKGLAVWYCSKPEYREYLRMLHFPTLMPITTQFKYLAGDMIFHPLLRPLWLKFARKLLSFNENLALKLYLKCYQAVKRETIKKEVKRLSC
ncbi:MAG: glycosyltransferase family 2 protein [Deltaproteobacteria bacterium]|nr:glycosyltransferase family 2 protein [Deltaproteobacteria bacterium]MBW2069206.1 glycosyltransferase family 2 protein [Deltaproteobacteria bacterium]